MTGFAVLLLALPLMDAPQLNARLVTGPEADSNARREISGEVPRPDLLWRSQLSSGLTLKEGIHRLTVDGQLGAKVFRQESTEDLFVAEARFRWDARPWTLLGTFVEMGGRDRRQRSGARSYDTFSMDGGVTVGPVGPVTVVLGGGPRLFAFWPLRNWNAWHDGKMGADPLVELSNGDVKVPLTSLLRFSNVGPGAFLAAVLQLTSVEMLSGSVGLDARYFPLGLRATTVQDGTRSFDGRGRPSDGNGWLGQLRMPPRRLDGSVFSEVTFESVRALYLRMSARLSANRSTSTGEQFYRGRLGLTAGGLLPGGVRLLLEAQLQATRWPEGLGLGETLALQEGDESQSSLSAQLSVPLRSGIWLEGKTAGYAAEFSSARTPFLRLIAFVGLSYRW